MLLSHESQVTSVEAPSLLPLLFLDNIKATDCQTLVSSTAQTMALKAWVSSFLLPSPLP